MLVSSSQNLLSPPQIQPHPLTEEEQYYLSVLWGPKRPFATELIVRKTSRQNLLFEDSTLLSVTNEQGLPQVIERYELYTLFVWIASRVHRYANLIPIWSEETFQNDINRASRG